MGRLSSAVPFTVTRSCGFANDVRTTIGQRCLASRGLSVAADPNKGMKLEGVVCRSRSSTVCNTTRATNWLFFCLCSCAGRLQVSAGNSFDCIHRRKSEARCRQHQSKHNKKGRDGTCQCRDGASHRHAEGFWRLRCRKSEDRLFSQDNLDSAQAPSGRQTLYVFDIRAVYAERGDMCRSGSC